jgi:hypothetical protein
MSLNSTTSRIVEEVSSALLEDSGFSTVLSLDFGSSDANENEVPTKINTPFLFDVRRFLPNVDLMDLDRFIEVAAELIEDAQDREGTVAAEQVTLVEDYPAERFDRFGEEVIAWKLISRRPGQMGRDATTRPQKGFTTYRQLRSPHHPNKFLEIEARPLDHIIEFQCWSKSARLANRRAIWLERLFVNHAWAFLAQGTDRFRFEERIADWYTNPGGQHLYVRPIRVFIRTYEFRVKADSVIKHITLEAGGLTTSELNSKTY